MNFARRLVEVLAEERQQPLRLWYLSFADESGFLGGAVVEAHGVVSAAMRCHELGINPGGEVQGFAVPEGREEKLPRDRLLTREEVEA